MKSLVLTLALALTLLLLKQAVVTEAYPYLGANAQRTGHVPASSIASKPNMTWHFDDPNGHSFMSNPVVSSATDAVYASSADGFVYGLNGTTGELLFEACVGTAPDFPGDPCGGVLFKVTPFGALALSPCSASSSGVAVIVLVDYSSHRAREMVALDGWSGHVLWRYTLRADGDPTAWGTFLSLPSPAVQPDTGVNTLLVWVKDAYLDHGMGAVYTVVSADTGAVLNATTYLTPQWRVFAPMTIDPADGSVYTQYTNDVQPACGRNGFQYMHCTGLGKYAFAGDNVVWNATLQDAFTYRLIALDVEHGLIHTPGSQQYAYAYTPAGRPQWKIMAAPSTGAIYAPTVCPSGNVVYLNDEHQITAWDTQLRRPKKPVWSTMCNGDCPTQATVVDDGTMYLMEGNSVVARSCDSGAVLWSIDYGTGESFTNTVAVDATGAIYATVYHGGIGGAVVKLQ